MSDGSSIEWTEATWNPVRGCTKVSPGCKHCYAETFAERWRGIAGHPFEQGFDLRLVSEKLDAPLRWKRPRKIFVNSMSDLFHEDVPNEYIAAVFGVMAACPQHTFQVLTKRAQRMREWFVWAVASGGIPKWLRANWAAVRDLFAAGSRFTTYRGKAIRSSDDAGSTVLNAAAVQMWPLHNVHLGVSVEDQDRANERIPFLLRTPATVRWISAEPLLGPVDLTHVHPPGFPYDRFDVVRGTYRGGLEAPRIDWVVVGAESGAGRHTRPMEHAWVRALRDQCASAGVAFFYKQDATPTGRKIKLPMLDGRQWQEYPEARP